MPAFCSTIMIRVSAETGLTIFAASIPSLRILFVRMLSSYDRTDPPPSSENYQLSSKCHHRNKSTRPEPYYYYSGDAITLSDPKDDSSAKSIPGKSGIKTTQEVSVTYERNADAKRGLEGELGVSSPTSPTRWF